MMIPGEGGGVIPTLTAEFLFMFRPRGQHNGSGGQIVFLRPAGLSHPGSLHPAPPSLKLLLEDVFPGPIEIQPGG